MERYDAGLLGGDSDWTVEQWHDYLRSELENAHEFYSSVYDDFAKEVAEYVGWVQVHTYNLNHLEEPKL